MIWAGRNARCRKGKHAISNPIFAGIFNQFIRLIKCQSQMTQARLLVCLFYDLVATLVAAYGGSYLTFIIYASL